MKIELTYDQYDQLLEEYRKRADPDPNATVNDAAAKAALEAVMGVEFVRKLGMPWPKPLEIELYKRYTVYCPEQPTGTLGYHKTLDDAKEEAEEFARRREHPMLVLDRTIQGCPGQQCVFTAFPPKEDE